MALLNWHRDYPFYTDDLGTVRFFSPIINKWVIASPYGGNIHSQIDLEIDDLQASWADELRLFTGISKSSNT
ncbi:MAG: hypothetical protein AAFQ89_22615 [Cyanobacteria bacterium J06626_18]